MQTRTLKIDHARRTALSEAHIRASVGLGMLSLVLGTQLVWSLLAH
ncbi:MULTISPECIES: hypothetical protein [Sphingobium]|uniref:Uncharacterized protein n=2 Tax=Sphingobium TaxID=165695 RepID=A0A9X7UKZ4_SPHYA|nr:hypothetical protein [Sphingobium yanoikuyae]QNG48750.1 hypothetical protein H3V42_15285 [Sphingobium yanoikuyae]